MSLENQIEKVFVEDLPLGDQLQAYEEAISWYIKIPTEEAQKKTQTYIKELKRLYSLYNDSEKEES